MEWRFAVSNPSPYERTGCVQLNLASLGVPGDIDAAAIGLFRVTSSGRQPVPFQIDDVVGSRRGPRVLVFKCTAPPSSDDDYGVESVRYVLAEISPGTGSATAPRRGVAIHHYRKDRSGAAPWGTMSTTFQPGDALVGVKLANRWLRVYVRLRREPHPTPDPNYGGAITSVEMTRARHYTGVSEHLNPYTLYPGSGSHDHLWGQPAQCSIPNLPWVHARPVVWSLLDEDYDLVHSHVGSVRACVTLRSQPRVVTFASEGNPVPLFDARASLYRVICLYPDHGQTSFGEQLFVATDEWRTIAFAPRFRAQVRPRENIHTKLARFENQAGYFAMWRHFSEVDCWRGYGIATDVPIRNVRASNGDLDWELAQTHGVRLIHQFDFEPSAPVNPLQSVGHDGWYEQVYKPLAPTDFRLWFPPPEGTPLGTP